ncbi:molybdate ABC transporter substrate-binding protein [Brachybacterium vulturis]|uniref:Molybdate-binding protein ModA n=1 Tax=Brachybacterium vulturis TaxID=2017484 RepID=A0A291GNM7_9MICO|nr:molybdate ABC transporter substrate-binding protein [Brachybacterium vulturis]ATG51788.1 molybdate ABC transporter substrate-binding protein [Brachybacterium vulturis]
MRGLVRRLPGAAAVMLLAAGCGGVAATEGAEDTVPLRVYAAASLQQPFDELGEAFEAAHDGVDVEFNFAGSSTLVQQIRQGAPADVFASANPENMDKLVEAGLHGSAPVDFTANTLMIAVPAGNPAGVTDLTSLTQEDLHLVVCAPEVPCGAATEIVEQAAGLTFSPVSEEQSVTDVLNKVTSGEADAGLVYVTDVARGGDAVEGIAFPEAQEAVNIYPITTVKDSEHLELAQEFVDLVSGPRGQEILDGYGFVGR